ncbi:probable E3 ubiquitin-protein ligase RHA4A isoform X2 [Mangifera indica]|uniref:probable E3 ubiquitin-protein ligase RHA4A isoform X2 n=1 Tax=Mangifera indica TaxID=29780 RepID=UPI001CFAFED4|nr:probable E3 ubiquitin-protein ligase RHA4A isoform X2 [Mangifera indica]
MGMPQSPTTTPHLYPQALQLKLYQAFIFSIPILFSIILFLLFYLFYLKRRASSLSSTPILPTSSNQASPFIHAHPRFQMGWDEEIKGKLPVILFDEELRERDSQCSVIPIIKLSNPAATPGVSESQQQEEDANSNVRSEQLQQQQQQLDGDGGSSDIANVCREQLVIRIEGSSSTLNSTNS